MRNLLVAVLCGMLWAAEAGCRAQVSIRPGLAAIRIHVRAEPKSGWRGPAPTEYAERDAPSNAGAYARVNYRALQNIVVWAAPTAAASSAPDPPAIVIGIGRDSAAALGATGVGGLLTVRNEGSTVEQVYSVSDANEFNLGAIPPGGEARHVVRAAGVIEVLSAARSDPIAVLYAAPTPWVRRVRSGGRVTFSNLPPGPCRIECWHPRLPGSQATVNLPADRVTEARLSVGVNELPKIP